MSELLRRPGGRAARQHRADASDDEPGGLPVVRVRGRVLPHRARLDVIGTGRRLIVAAELVG